MVSVNASRSGLVQKVNEAVKGARLIGFDAHGQACVWYGGYGFNVYDVTSGWTEVSHFTSGDLAGMTDRERHSVDGIALVADRMLSEGFHPITPDSE